MQPTRQSSKTRTMNLVMQNPEFARALKEAWDAPFGSTKRERAKSVLNILKKTQPNFEREDVQAAATLPSNPWASLPAFVPTLNYAPTAPERGKKESGADGQGGPGPTSTFIGPQMNPAPIGPQMNPAPKPPASMAEQHALKSWQQGGPTQGLIPQVAQWGLGEAMQTPRNEAEKFEDYMAGAGVVGKTLLAGAGVIGGAGEAVGSKVKELYHRAGTSLFGGDPAQITPATPYSQTHGAQWKEDFMNQDVGESRLASRYPYLFGPGTPPAPPVSANMSTEVPRTAKQILKGDGNTLYAWDGKSIRKIADTNTLQQLIRQGYVDTRAPLSRFYKPSSLTLGNGATPASGVNMTVGKNLGSQNKVTGAGSASGYQSGTTQYGPNDPYSAAYGSSSSSTSGSGTPGSGTTFTGTGSAYGALNRIPGLDINAPENQGLGMIEYESKALNILSKISDADWNAAFPGQPKPFGADLVGHTQQLIELKKSELGLDQMQKQLTQMVSENPTFALDARDYIVGQDEHLKKIDPLLEDARNQLANNSDFPLLRAMNQNYVNYLATMKGKTVQRYATYLNKAVDVRNAEVTRLRTDIGRAQQELNMAIPMIQAKSSQDYERIVKIIDENWQKPALAAQAERDRVKDERDSMKANLDIIKLTAEVEGLGSENNDDFLKAKEAFIKAASVPGTGGWNPGVSDITDLIKKTAATYPLAAYEAMKQIMPASLRSPEKDSNGNTLPGLFNKQKMINTYMQAISSHFADLSNQAAQLDAAFTNEKDPTLKQQYSTALGQVTRQISELAKVQMQVGAAVGERLAENFAGLDDKGMEEIRNSFVETKWSPKLSSPFNSAAQPANFSEEKKRDFVARFAPKLGDNQEVATWVFDMIKKNVEAGAKLHGTNVLDARFYFDPKTSPSGEQIPAANKTNISNDVLRYIMANFGVHTLMDHSSPIS